MSDTNKCNCSSIKKDNKNHFAEIILGSVLIICLSTVVNTSIETHSLNARERIKTSASIKIAKINHEYEGVDNKDINGFYDSIGSRGQGNHYKNLGLMDKVKSEDVLDNDESDIIDIEDNINTLSSDDTFNNGKATEALSPEQINKINLLTEEKVKPLCPQIKNVIAGKTDEQIQKYERIVATQLMPDNSEQAMKIMNKVIANCSSREDN